MNTPYNVIILAGGSGGALAEQTGVPRKANLKIHGRPMLDWVVNEFDRSPEANNLVVVGAHELDELSCIKKVRKRLSRGINVFHNLINAVGYLKARVYKGRKNHQGYIISFCDAVFLTESVITDTLKSIRETEADIVLHYVEKSSFEAAGLPAERTYIQIGDGYYTGSTIYYVRNFKKIFTSLGKLYQMRKNRKDPAGLLRVLGCEGKDFPAIEAALSEHLGAKVRILVSPHVEMGMDVDKPSHLALAKEMLAA